MDTRLQSAACGVKAIFFDIDGTLLSNRTNKISQSTIDALDRASRSGIMLFVATGRHKQQVDDLKELDSVGFKGYVTLNGQYCYEHGGNVVYKNPINTRDVELMSEYAQRTSTPCIFLESDRLYVNILNDHVRNEHEAVTSSIPEERDTSRMSDREIFQMGLYLKDGKVPEILDSLPGCTYTRWKTSGVDIIPLEGGKWTGIERMIEHFGLSPEQTMSFGDNDNDIEMLANTGISVAMGNSGDHVKSVADYVTDDVDEDGIYKAMHRLFNWS